MKSEIITDFWEKPIPTRDFDWAAYRDGYEEGDNIGWGATKEEAIEQLLIEEEEE